jgi:hypothetical protein
LPFLVHIIPPYKSKNVIFFVIIFSPFSSFFNLINQKMTQADIQTVKTSNGQELKGEKKNTRNPTPSIKLIISTT